MHGIPQPYRPGSAHPLLGLLLVMLITAGGCSDQLLPPTAPPTENTPSVPEIFYSVMGGNGNLNCYRIPATGGYPVPVLQGQIVARPQGSKILYSSGDSLVVWDTVTKTRQVIDQFDAEHQLFAADFLNGRVAYSTYSKTGEYTIQVVSLDGTLNYSLGYGNPFGGVLPDNYLLVVPIFSPDGTRIAYFAPDLLSGYTLTVLSVATAAVSQIPGLSPTTPFPLGVDWSPTGDSLVIATADDIAANGFLQSSLYIVDIPTLTLTPLLTPQGASSYSYSFPAWSPDGTRIAFMFGDTTFDVWMIDVRDKSMMQLTSIPETTEAYPQWSADGTRLLYVDDYGRLQVVDMTESVPIVKPRAYNVAYGYWSR